MSGTDGSEDEFNHDCKLPPKQLIFCLEYLVDLNATQAAIRAGYSKTCAMEIGYQLLQKTSVQEFIKMRMDERAKRLTLKADRILEELCLIAFSDITGLLAEDGTLRPVNEWDSDCAKAIKSYRILFKHKDGRISKKIEFYDKVKALYMLALHLGIKRS